MCQEQKITFIKLQLWLICLDFTTRATSWPKATTSVVFCSIVCNSIVKLVWHLFRKHTNWPSQSQKASHQLRVTVIFKSWLPVNQLTLTRYLTDYTATKPKKSQSLLRCPDAVAVWCRILQLWKVLMAGICCSSVLTANSRISIMLQYSGHSSSLCACMYSIGHIINLLCFSKCTFVPEPVSAPLLSHWNEWAACVKLMSAWTRSWSWWHGELPLEPCDHVLKGIATFGKYA